MKNAINTIKLSACISAQDGVISNRELDTCFELISEKYTEIDKDLFDATIDAFFDENLSLDDYLQNMLAQDHNDNKNILKICYESAISDGFDIKENLAFTKACSFFNIDEKEITDA